MRQIINRANRQRWQLGTILGALAGVVLGAHLATATGPRPAFHRLGIVGGDPAALLHVSLFAAPGTASDQAPAALLHHLSAMPDPAHSSRYMGTMNGYRYYAVPAINGTLCIGGIRHTARGDYTASTCESDAHLLTGAIWVDQVDTATGTQYVAGVAPDAFTQLRVDDATRNIANNAFTVALAKSHVLVLSGAGFVDRHIDIGAFVPLSARKVVTR